MATRYLYIARHGDADVFGGSVGGAVVPTSAILTREDVATIERGAERSTDDVARPTYGRRVKACQTLSSSFGRRRSELG